MKFYLSGLVVIVLISGCASDHDLKRDGQNFFGGGYIDDELGVGLYSIKAFSNSSPFSTPDSAKKTFTNRAETLCKGTHYKIINSNLGTHDASSAGAPPLKVSFMAGNILCSNSPITIEAAKKLLSLE